MKSGEVEKIEAEYIRRGITGIIASRNVATGEIMAPLIQATRTEEDFVDHIKNGVSFWLNQIEIGFGILSKKRLNREGRILNP